MVALALEKFNFKSIVGADPGVDELPSYFVGLRGLLGQCESCSDKFRTSHRAQVRSFPEFEPFHGNRGFLDTTEA